MEIKTIFLFFGIGLACIALVVSIIGLRAKDFPSRGAFVGILALMVVFVVGTGMYAMKLSTEETHERDDGEQAIGEEETEAAGIKIIRNTS